MEAEMSLSSGGENPRLLQRRLEDLQLVHDANSMLDAGELLAQKSKAAYADPAEVKRIIISLNVEDRKHLTESGPLDDGYMWRKYGEKRIKHCEYARSYFKCAACHCQALRTIERKSTDSFLITYIGRHTCKSRKTPSIEELLPDIFTTAEQFKAFVDGISSQYTSTSPSSEVCFTLTLDDICQGRCLEMAVRVQLPTQKNVNALCFKSMEFLFFHPEDMAICVGIGISQAKVFLDDNFNISIHEVSGIDKELVQAFGSYKQRSDEDSHLKMTLTQENEPSQVLASEQVLKLIKESGKTLPSVHGIGFNKVSNYGNETVDYTERNRPLLYDIALFVVAKMSTKKCNNQTTENAEPSASFKAHPNNSMRQTRIYGKRRCPLDGGYDSQGGEGDGDEDGSNEIPFEGNENMDTPEVLRIIVHPLPKEVVFDENLGVEVLLPRSGLEGASIATELVFDFYRNNDCRKISITASSRLELATERTLFYNDSSCFGWYQNEIQIKLGCVEESKSVQRTAILQHGSCRMLNPITSSKYIAGKTDTSSIAHNHSAKGTVNVSLGGMVGLEGALSGSQVNEVGTSSGQSLELTTDSVCGGFYFRDCSRSESPAYARFELFYPLDNFMIWHNHDRRFLMSQGLVSTIEPQVTGTWIPFNELDASPYLFSIDRILRLHKRYQPHRKSEELMLQHVMTYKQNYLLTFYINHAMTHLRRERVHPVELHGDHQQVPNVLKVARVY